MDTSNNILKKYSEKEYPSIVRNYTIRGKEYVVKSVFVGDKDVKTVLFDLAAKKAFKEMGIDYNIPYQKQSE